MAGIGPGPFTAMMLADMGADVIRVDRTRFAATSAPPDDLLNRGRRSVAIDIWNSKGREALLQLVEQADALIEGHLPGAMERLGLGPEECMGRNPRLVYGRMTGWGQDGPLARCPGHDIDYLALSGALHCFARAGQKPVPPLNLVGDFGGGGLLQAFGVACALLEARASGVGQVVDTAMVDGTAVLMTMIYGWQALGLWDDDRPGTNLLDTGAPFYDVYETADGRLMAIGAVEPRFFGELLDRLGLADDEVVSVKNQMQRRHWPAMKDRIAAVFATRTRDEWCELLEGSEACCAPVLSLGEAPEHMHNRARGTFIDHHGVTQPAPAPRFSRTKPELGRKPPAVGEHTDEVLREWGFDAASIAELHHTGAVA